MKEKTEKKMAVMAGILLGVSAVVMLITHHLVPFMMDDLWYSTMLSDETPITSFSDIVKSQIWHYNNWGGRSMTHGILQLTLLMGENVADVLNVLVTFLLAGMICLVAENRSLPVLLAAVGMLLGLSQLENEYVLAGGSRQLSLYHGISSFLCILLSAGAARTDTGSGEKEAAGDFPLDNPTWDSGRLE